MDGNCICIWTSGQAAHRKHKRKTGKRLKFPGLAPLTDNVLRLAALPLPTGEMCFHDAVEGILDADFLHSCDMGVWAKRPPFPVDAASRSQDIDTVQQILLGLWVRALPAESVRRRAEFKVSRISASDKLRAEIQALHDRMRILAAVEYTPGTLQHSMLQFWLRLDAMQIHYLYNLKFLE